MDKSTKVISGGRHKKVLLKTAGLKTRYISAGCGCWFRIEYLCESEGLKCQTIIYAVQKKNAH